MEKRFPEEGGFPLQQPIPQPVPTSPFYLKGSEETRATRLVAQTRKTQTAVAKRSGCLWHPVRFPIWKGRELSSPFAPEARVSWVPTQRQQGCSSHSSICCGPKCRGDSDKTASSQGRQREQVLLRGDQRAVRHGQEAGRWDRQPVGGWQEVHTTSRTLHGHMCTDCGLFHEGSSLSCRKEWSPETFHRHKRPQPLVIYF